MKTKWIAALLLAIGLGAVAASAGAGSGRITTLTADLTLRPGVIRSNHPAVAPHGLYGALDATYNSGTARLAYTLDYKGLNGSATRVIVRSRATGATLAVLCNFCHPRPAGPGHEGLPVSHLAGRVSVDPDVGFLITSARTFVEIDTTAYPSGEIGGPILPPPTYTNPVTRPGHYHGGGGPFKPPPTQGGEQTERCC
jgi:hypothetical protein